MEAHKVVIIFTYENAGLFIPCFYIVEYARTFSPRSSVSPFYVLSVLNAGSVAGRLFPSVLADSFGRFNLLIPSALICGLSCLLFWIFAHSMVSVLLFAAVYGFGNGAFIALVAPCVAQISEREAIGSRIGGLYSIMSFPCVSFFTLLKYD